MVIFAVPKNHCLISAGKNFWLDSLSSPAIKSFLVGFLTTLGVGVGFFCLTLDVQLDHFLHHTPKLGIPVEMVQFLLKLLLKQSSCCVP